MVNQIYKKKQIPILDDEKYFVFYGDDMPKNCGFYTDDIKSTPNSVKYKEKEKFPKILVWIGFWILVWSGWRSGCVKFDEKAEGTQAPALRSRRRETATAH